MLQNLIPTGFPEMVEQIFDTDAYKNHNKILHRIKVYGFSHLNFYDPIQVLHISW